MKRHIEWFTQPDQTLKDRSRFWTWYMRGLHGDMDTRYEGDRRSSSRASSQVPGGRHIYTSTSPNVDFNFRPLASNVYGYHPRGVSLHRRPEAGLAAQQALAQENALNSVPAVDTKRPNWSTPLKNLDDLMLLREPRSTSVPPLRRAAPPSPLTSRLRRLAIDPALEDLHNNRTWSEFRPASTGEMTEAERAMNKLKTIIGYCKPYDRQCQSAIHEMEKCLSGVEKLSAAL